MSLQSVYLHNLLTKSRKWKMDLAEISCGHLFSKVIPTPVTKGFRSRAKYKIFGDPDGFSIRATDPIRGDVPYADTLWMLPSYGKKLTRQIVEIISSKISFFWVDGFEIQLSHGKRTAHLTLSVKRIEKRSYADLAELLLDKITPLEGVSIPSQRQNFGKAYLLHRILGKKFISHYSAFFQSNLRLTPGLVEEIQSPCLDLKFFRILDLYCGVGLFSLSLADANTPSVGVDIDKRAIDSARLNAKNLDFTGASFVCSPVENFLQGAFISPNDLVIIDPPRSGCSRLLVDILSKKMPNYIFSVSCNPLTHIRDLKSWIENGYTIQSISAFDMFPFTEFLETIAFLKRKN